MGHRARSGVHSLRRYQRGILHHLTKDEPAGPAKLNALFTTLRLAEAAGDREAYLDDLNAAIQIQPTPQLLLQRAQLAEQDKDYPRALADYLQLLNGPAGKNPQQATELRARIEAVRLQMDSESKQMREQTRMIEDGLERANEVNSTEAKQQMNYRIGAVLNFSTGTRAYEAGDLDKAREFWSKAANAGHEGAAAQLKRLPDSKP